MAGHWTDLFSFVTGAIRERDLGYLVLSNDEAATRKVPLAGIVQWEPDGWGDAGQVKWRVAGAVIAPTPKEQLCAVGEFGQALFVGSGDKHEETIGKGRDSPKERGPLRGARTIGGRVHAVGMDRQAYRRDAPGKWTLLGNGLPPTGAQTTVGFEAVDGFSENDLYTCGWDGELWKFDGDRWSSLPSPVNTVLVEICCGGDGNVYACGRNGVLLRGRDDVWEIVSTSLKEDLWGLAWFRDRLYLSTMENVFTLQPDGLHLVTWGKEKVKTCYDLVTGAGLLWSIGAKDVVSFDGKKWSRID